jgi:glucose-6-phosphate isomerase
MNKLQVKLDNIYQFAPSDEIQSLKGKIEECQRQIDEKTGKGNDFLGWVSLPTEINDIHIKSIVKVASELKLKSEIVVVIGIGGSYLGAKAVIEALGNSFSMLDSEETKVLFAGNSICEDYHADY